MKLSLVVLTPGPSEGKVVPITPAQFVIGRDPGCQLRPASIHISKRHCALLKRDNKVFVRDFGSTNGTFVNDRQIRGEIELLDGDQLRVGPLLFGVKVEPAPVNRPTPLPPTKETTQKVAPAPAPEGSPTESPAAAGNEEDAAAMLLSMQDGDVPPGSASPQVPEGSTVFDLPAPTDAEKAAKEKEKPKQPTGDTSTAAKTILEKYLKRPRT
jgi:pSer/pThr/pTyr-binding forkhead associated (FHA) protein